MAGPMIAMAAVSLVQQHSAKNRAMKAAANDIKLQRAKMERARSRKAGDLATNTQRAREASQKREIAIEQNRLKAESKLDETFAGSGISGTSVDELDNELNAAVAKNKHENKQALDQTIADEFRANRQSAEDLDVEAAQIGAGTPEKATVGEMFAAGVSGAKQGSALQSEILSATSKKGKAGLDIGSMASISNYLGFK